jgi:hypothetical protein
MYSEHLDHRFSDKDSCGFRKLLSEGFSECHGRDAPQNEPACAGGAAREMARWAVAVVIG